MKQYAVTIPRKEFFLVEVEAVNLADAKEKALAKIRSQDAADAGDYSYAHGDFEVEHKGGKR